MLCVCMNLVHIVVKQDFTFVQTFDHFFCRKKIRDQQKTVFCLFRVHLDSEIQWNLHQTEGDSNTNYYFLHFPRKKKMH